MTTGEASAATSRASTRPQRIALIGNPNTGKTTLFNRLCGVRLKTSNFPGTTQEARIGFPKGGRIELIDLPGVYSMETQESESVLCRRVLAGEMAPRGEPAEAPDAVCVVLDATNLPKSLGMLGEALRRRLPTVVAINFVDVARRRGIHGNEERLGEILGCPVVVCSARTGEGLDALRAALSEPRIATNGPAGDQEALQGWVDALSVEVFKASEDADRQSFTDRLDRAFTHPILGLVGFAAVMTGLFWVIFKVAARPMEWIDGLFGVVAGGVHSVLGDGILGDLLADGVVAGVGATLIFLPQIFMLFFLIALLEDTGYLARAAFVMDRVLRPFGMSGHAFVPLLSSHACALPGIMAARAIPDRRDRLATILVAPFMTCTARIPVYILLVSILFPGRPAVQAIAFTGGYVLGIVAGLLSSLIARRTILRGKSRSMVLELPDYRVPSLRTAGVAAYQRGLVFLKKAGTVILAISIALWWLGAYPQAAVPSAATDLREQASVLDGDDVGSGVVERADELRTEADMIAARHQARESFMGRLGRVVEPVFEPLGFDRQLTVGVLASFAAREVFVTTMSVLMLGDADVDPGDVGVLERIAQGKRDDGTPVFTVSVSWSLFVYYVLAMQCLPTLAVTAREAGGARWAFLQLVWMCGMAYAAAFLIGQVL